MMAFCNPNECLVMRKEVKTWWTTDSNRCTNKHKHSRRQQNRRAVVLLEIALTLVERVERVWECVWLDLSNHSVCSFVELSTPQQQLLPLGIWLLLSSSFPREQVSKDNFSECGMFGYIGLKHVGFGRTLLSLSVNLL